MKRKSFKPLGRDLYFELECTCPHPLFQDSDVSHLFKNKVKLRGYDDDYFFDTVNAAPRKGACSCGRTFQYQWFRDGVEAKWDDVA
jgi:hypothetical protein